jgi:hypothetical protein
VAESKGESEDPEGKARWMGSSDYEGRSSESGSDWISEREVAEADRGHDSEASGEEFDVSASSTVLRGLLVVRSPVYTVDQSTLQAQTTLKDKTPFQDKNGPTKLMITYLEYCEPSLAPTRSKPSLI